MNFYVHTASASTRLRENNSSLAKQAQAKTYTLNSTRACLNLCSLRRNTEQGWYYSIENGKKREAAGCNKQCCCVLCLSERNHPHLRQRPIHCLLPHEILFLFTSHAPITTPQHGLPSPGATCGGHSRCRLGYRLGHPSRLGPLASILDCAGGIDSRLVLRKASWGFI